MLGEELLTSHFDHYNFTELHSTHYATRHDNPCQKLAGGLTQLTIYPH